MATRQVTCSLVLQKHTGCNHALFTIKTVVDHYTSSGFCCEFVCIRHGESIW